MTTNPFEDDSAEFLVLTNAEEQHSLWPVHLDVPAGWRTVAGPGERQAMVEWVDEHWTDMRPKSLRDAMTADSR